MHTNRVAWKRWLVAGACLAWVALPSSDAQQQGGANPIGRVRLAKQMTRSPSYTVNTNVQALNRKTTSWTAIETRYETVLDWTDDLTITYYVWMETDNPKERNVLLRCEDTFLNVEKGTHQDFAFVPPSVLKRYGRISGMAVEFSYQGRVVASESDPKTFNYKNAVEQLPKKEGLLLARSKSPFALVDVEGFELSKAEAPR